MLAKQDYKTFIQNLSVNPLNQWVFKIVKPSTKLDNVVPIVSLAYHDTEKIVDVCIVDI